MSKAAASRDAETTAELLLSGSLTAASVEHGGCLSLAAATSYSVELWKLCDLGNPGSAQQLHGGLASPDARAVALWADAPRLWLATVEWSPGQRWLRIRDISGCAGGCSSLPAPAAEFNVSGTPASVLDLLTYSKAGDVETLCYGLEEGGDLRGLGRGRCWRVEDPSAPVEIGAEGGTYAGGCAGEQVDAGGDSQSGNVFGNRNFDQRTVRAYLIDGKIVILRAAYGQLDALVYTPPAVDPAVLFSDDFELGDASRWSP